MKSDFACPIPLGQYPKVVLAHGGGGTLMAQLIEKMFLPTFANPLLETRHDGAVLDIEPKKLAFTTDSYVVRPLFFATLTGNLRSSAPRFRRPTTAILRR